MCRILENTAEQAAEKATLGLARVGSRTALSFAFAFLRRAWRSGEDQVMQLFILKFIYIVCFDISDVCQEYSLLKM
jgi:hypothetical protein